MRRTRWLIPLLLVSLATTGCWVQKAEFEEYKKHISAQGDSLDAWNDVVQKNLEWLRADYLRRNCPDPTKPCSDPPPLPPPPPKGKW